MKGILQQRTTSSLQEPRGETDPAIATDNTWKCSQYGNGAYLVTLKRSIDRYRVRGKFGLMRLRHTDGQMHNGNGAPTTRREILDHKPRP